MTAAARSNKATKGADWGEGDADAIAAGGPATAAVDLASLPGGKPEQRRNSAAVPKSTVEPPPLPPAPEPPAEPAPELTLDELRTLVEALDLDVPIRTLEKSVSGYPRTSRTVTTSMTFHFKGTWRTGNALLELLRRLQSLQVK